MKGTYPRVAISNGRLHATVCLPDAETGFYRGSRFDWSGVIDSLEYEGHNYYGPWFDRIDPAVRDFVYDGAEIVAGPCSAITGPVEEFSTGGKALGYDEAEAGGTFLKIGVGVLRKRRESDYDEYRLYEIVDPGKWTVHSESDSVEFVQEVCAPSGFAYQYRKIVRLARNKPEMELEHSLRNTGRRPIESSVYNHNFLVLDGQAPGPDFRITVPFEMRPEQPPPGELAEIRGRQIVYAKELENEECVSASLKGFGHSAHDHDIRIENRTIGAGLRITGDRPLERLALWSIRSVLSMEPFIAVAVDPGNEFTWKLSYDFYTSSGAATAPDRT